MYLLLASRSLLYLLVNMLSIILPEFFHNFFFSFPACPGRKKTGAASRRSLSDYGEGEGELSSMIKGIHPVYQATIATPATRANISATLFMSISPRRAIISTPYMPTPVMRLACTLSSPRSFMACLTIFSTAGRM